MSPELGQPLLPLPGAQGGGALHQVLQPGEGCCTWARRCQGVSDSGLVTVRIGLGGTKDGVSDSGSSWQTLGHRRVGIVRIESGNNW